MENKLMETTMLLQAAGYDDFDVEEIIDDYLPRVREHMGFVDERSDKRFVVKFHDVCYFTRPEEGDMEQELFDDVFEAFCQNQYDFTKELIHEGCSLEERQIFKPVQVGHYDAFEYVQEEPITEENVLDVAMNIYNEGLSPAYIDDYVKIVEHLQDMEDNYMTYWLEFLRDNEYIPEEKIKIIERRWEDYKKKHELK